MAFYHGLRAMSHLAAPAVGDKVQGKVTYRWTSRPRGGWNPLSKLIINYLFFPNFSCLNFWVFFLCSNTCPSSFSWPVSRIIFPPCRIKKDNVLQLGGTFVWVLSHLIMHPQWTKPTDFLTHLPWSWTLLHIRIPDICTDFTDGETLFSSFTSWFYRYWGKIILPCN